MEDVRRPGVGEGEREARGRERNGGWEEAGGGGGGKRGVVEMGGRGWGG